MNETLKPARPAGLTLRIITVLVAANGLALTADAGSCDGTINAIKSWLQGGPPNYARAVVTSNQPAAAPGMDAEVTYANISLKLGAAGSLVTDVLGTRYYDDHLWGWGCAPGTPCLPYTPYPFSPDATDEVALTITSTGTVHIYSVVGFTFPGYTFTASCSSQGVLYGEPPLSTTPYGVLPVPFYSITFEKGTGPK